MMQAKFIAGVSIAIASLALSLTGCKKAAQAPVDPHSVEAIVQSLKTQRAFLDEAVKRKDFAVVDDRAFYLQGVLKALYAKLDAGQQQRLETLFNEVTRVAEELDHAAGRRHEEATVASMQKLQGLLNELEAQFNTGKKA